MRLGIDASNIRAGGGVTHLVELLRTVEPTKHGFEQVFLWGGADTLQRVQDRIWLRKVHDPLLDRSLIVRVAWQRLVLGRLVQQAGCNILFAPGGTYRGDFRPYVTMSQNLLPFQRSEAQRYRVSWMFLRLLVLRQSQAQTMRRANGVIFLTDHARGVVMSALKRLMGPAMVIPHGVSKEFLCPPRPQYGIDRYSFQKPFRILYVSVVTVYKHQWHVAEAVAALRSKGLPVHLELVGPAYPPALRRLLNTLQRLDPDEEFIHYRGPICHTELHKEYQRADSFVFASSCEAFGQVVTEAMSAGLPIACSNTGTMRELLAGNALYFDPEQPNEIANVLEKIIEDPILRMRLAWGAHELAQALTWERCAAETFSLIAQVACAETV